MEKQDRLERWDPEDDRRVVAETEDGVTRYWALDWGGVQWYELKTISAREKAAALFEQRSPQAAAVAA